MNKKCNKILFVLIVIILILIILYVCFKNSVDEGFSNIEMKNNLNDLDYLFDFKDFKKNMNEKCNNITQQKNELNKLIENECKNKDINTDIKCRKLQDSGFNLDENKKNYCLFSDNQIEGFTNVNYYNYN